jgi:tRNA(fMet)-specific endonuclease VapC
MKFLLDTNACICFLKNTSEAFSKRFLANHDKLSVCPIVKAELYFGAQKSGKRKANLEKIETFFENLDNLPFSDNAVKVYGEIRFFLEKKGKKIGPNDLIIASIAIAHNATLITHNTKEFVRVKGLKIQDWEGS